MKLLALRLSVSFAIAAALLSFSVIETTGGEARQHVPPGVCQLVETRNGRIDCWGLIIQLGKMTFSGSVSEDQLSITELKHGHDLKDIMVWDVDKQRKKLTIKFKPGMGGFGTGNSVTISIDGSAFSTNPMEKYSFTIATDLL